MIVSSYSALKNIRRFTSGFTHFLHQIFIIGKFLSLLLSLEKINIMHNQGYQPEDIKSQQQPINHYNWLIKRST